MSKTPNLYFRSESEVKDIANVLLCGHRWGFGNLIHELKIEWAMLLVRDWGLSETAARLAAGFEVDEEPVEGQAIEKEKP